MATRDELLHLLLRLRLDIAAGVVAALAAVAWSRYVLRRRGGREFFPAAALLAAAVLLLTGIVAVEWLVMPGAQTLTGDVGPLLAVRAAVLGAVVLAAVVCVAGGTITALRRAEIHEHSRTEAKLEEARTAADAASRAKSEFLAVMSHEIRTPLNAVMGFANLLGETKLDDAQRGYLATIVQEGRRLTSLVSDLLDLTKIEQGRLVLERVPFSPVETAHEVLRLLSPRALEKQLDLRFEALVAGPLLIAGDPLRFRQVLLNLVDNAIKFTPNGHVTLFLAWTPPATAQSHGRLDVRVRDTGIGIPAEKLKYLFQMFTQLDASTTRRHGGTGLGLAICQRLVGMMGGTIVARSVVGGGAEFSFHLPATPVAPPEDMDSGPAMPVQIPSRKPRVLVVDDMDTNRLLLEVFLGANGFAPELASGGEEAVQLAATRQYDAILMDLQMPEVDGYSATRRIRATEPAGRHTPIIALTASVTKGTREKCLEAGMDDYLSKPLDLRKFKSLLNGVITGGASRPRVFQAAPA
jgi:signal transduction histidine kinase/ActR/RegA family two-component response regulator